MRLRGQGGSSESVKLSRLLLYLDGLAEAPDGPILHRRDEVG